MRSLPVEIQCTDKTLTQRKMLFVFHGSETTKRGLKPQVTVVRSVDSFIQR